MMASVRQVTDFLLDNTKADFREVIKLSQGWWSVIATTARDYELLYHCPALTDVRPVKFFHSNAVMCQFRLNHPLLGCPDSALPNYAVSLSIVGNQWHWSVMYTPDSDSTRVLVDSGKTLTFDDATTAVRKAINWHWKGQAK